MLDSTQIMAAACGWSGNKDDYDLGEVIGVGSTSIVHQAYCKPRKEPCAIKRIHIEKENRRVEELNEIQVLINTSHKNVVKYFSSFVVNDELWLVLSLFQGGSVLDIINNKQRIKNCRRGVLDETTIAALLRKVLKALESLHHNGLVHGDMKAENLLFSEDGNIQIGAFGLNAWFSIGGNHSEDKTTQTVLENAKWHDPKSDIWSFGIAAIELTTGKSPYHEYQEKKIPMSALESNPLNVKVNYEHFSHIQYVDHEKLRKVVATCLEDDPAKRPTATELLNDPFFKKAKKSKFLKQTLSPFIPSMELRVLKIKSVKRLPEVTGWKYQDESGDWVWSSDEREKQAESQHQSVVANLISF